MNSWARKLALLVALCTLLTACAPAGDEGGDLSGRKINAVATTNMVADLVKVIGGERVEVTPLMGAGVDPHLYKASAGDVTRLESADVIFYNGLHLEAAMGEVLFQMGVRKTTVAVTDIISKELLLQPAQFQGNFDPHIWFDVTLWMEAADRVRMVLSYLDPTNREIYTANAEAYLVELRELHEYVKAQVGKLPEEKRVLITAHDAFNYFGRAYGFDVRGLQGISTVSEPSPRDLQELADFISSRKIPAVFIESSVPRRTIEALQAAVKDRGFDVQIGGQLYSDALGSPGTPEGTYIGMVRYNVDTIVSALAK